MSRTLAWLVVALAIVTASDAAHPQDIHAMNNRIHELYNSGRHAEASSMAEKLVPLVSAEYGAGGDEHADALHTLAWAYSGEGRKSDAVPIFEQALKLGERIHGPVHWWIAQACNNLALAYWDLGRTEEAESLFRRSLTIREKTAKAGSSEFLNILGNLGQLVLKQGRVREAEPLFMRAMAIAEKGQNDPSRVAIALNNMAELRQYQGRDVEAEQFMLRSLAVREKAYGPNHAVTARGLTNLANLFNRQSRPYEAFPVLLRSLEINLGTVGPDHPEVTRTLILLAGSPALPKSGDVIAAIEKLLKQQLAHRERTEGPDTPAVDRIVNALSKVYFATERVSEVEPLFRRRLAYANKVHRPDSLEMSDVLDGIGHLHVKQGRYKDAIEALQRSIAIEERVHGSDSPVTLHAHGTLAAAYAGLKDWPSAARELRRSVAVLSKQDRAGDAGQASERGQRLIWREQTYTHALIQVLYRLGASDTAIADESFMTAQLALLNDASVALARMSARVAAGSDKLAGIVRERQDLIFERSAKSKQLLELVSNLDAKRDDQTQAALRSGVAKLDARLEKINSQIRSEFPRYAAIADPEPLSIKELQAILGPNEALALFVDLPIATITEPESFAWMITRNDARWLKLKSAPQDFEAVVRTLRCGLDQDGAWEWSAQLRRWSGRAKECQDLRPDGLGEGEPLPFDADRAYALYKELIAPFEGMLANADGSMKQLMVVPSASLAALPFNVLVTEAPDASRATPFSSLKWLAYRQAVSILPSVTSLKSLREFARVSSAPNHYLGFGNPLLTGPRGNDRRAWQFQNCKESSSNLQVATRKIARASKPPGRGERADLAALRAQEPLPETAIELCEVGRSLGATASVVHLGTNATERNIKSFSDDGTLARTRILHFATHGLLAHETRAIGGAAEEPALLLTPPKQATAEDDGLLTASEIGQLKLNADWVVLSACNTAGGKSVLEREPLSGLARAFFYAGTRAMLVTHWYVNSQAAVALVTRTFAGLEANAQMGRAEAMRQSMLALAKEPATAHPAIWAPFVVVGDGAR